MKGFLALSFSKKYTLALSLIALFSILAFFILTQIISSQENDGEVINISGKQRMLSQRTAIFTMNNNLKKLDKTIQLMDDSHKKLISLEMSLEIHNLYFEKPMLLDTKVKKYIKNAKDYANNENKKSLLYIIDNSQKLLKDLDIAVSIYQNEAEAKIKNLQTIELYIMILTLTTLILEAIFIFRPIDKSVKRKTKEILVEKSYSDMITQINTNAIIAVNEKFEILTFNKSAEEIFGYKAHEMLRTKLIDDRIIPKKFLDRHNAGLASFMKVGELKNKNVVFELEGQHKDKTIFPIRISFGTKIERNQKVVVANIQDITQEKNKDALIIQQSRFAAMGEMIGNIAHQWRQPLSSISAIATGTKLRYKNNMIEDKELLETFDKIKVHTQHLSTTIDDFRDFFSEDRKKELFNITDVVNKSISLVEAMYMDNHIKLHTQIKDNNIMIDGSSSELSQVFLNILNNAKDIFVEKNIKNPTVTIIVEKEDNHAKIFIKDNAGGIADNIQAKIFEPYFTTKHKSQGTGIGLFMSKKIIEQHYGGILNSTNEEFKIDGEKFFGASFNIKIKANSL